MNYRWRLFALLCLCFLSFSCAKTVNKNLDTEQKVTITIVGDYEKVNELVLIFDEFSKRYPNCRVEYEHMDDYNRNLQLRLESKENLPNLFFTNSIKKSSPYVPYVLDLASPDSGVDLSDTSESVTNNYKDGASLYSVPVACTVRGILVNKSKIESFGMSVPQNRAELLSVCAKLKENGITPFFSHKSNCGQLLMYPLVCNIVAHSSEAYKAVSEHAAGAAEYFRAPVELFYEIELKDYVDYKSYSADFETQATRFLSGGIAMYPCAMEESLAIALSAQYNEAYQESPFEFEFICPPVDADGACCYISPWRGIAVVKDAPNSDWAVEFLNFLMTKKNLNLLAKQKGLIPNSADMYTAAKEHFELPVSRITDVGQATFDFSFYNIMRDVLVDIANEVSPTKTAKKPDDFIMSLEEAFQEK